MGLFGRPAPKDDDPGQELEDPRIVEINEYHDNARKFRRVGDKVSDMIFEHHRDEARRQFQQEEGCLVRFDEKRDRWYPWR